MQALKRSRRLWAAAGAALALAAVVVWRVLAGAPEEEPVEPVAVPAPPAVVDAGAVAVAPSAVADAGAARAPVDARRPPRVTPAAVARLTETVLMAHLREVAASDPNAAVELARQGNQRFPDSPDAPERTSILIHALSALDRPSEARGEAEHMVNHYPDSSWVREIEGFTGAHRHRNLQLNDAGQIEYKQP